MTCFGGQRSCNQGRRVERMDDRGRWKGRVGQGRKVTGQQGLGNCGDSVGNPSGIGGDWSSALGEMRAVRS